MAYPAYYSCTDEVDPHSPVQTDTTHREMESVDLQARQPQPLTDTIFEDIAPLHVESAVTAFETAECQHHHLPHSDQLSLHKPAVCDPLFDTQQPPLYGNDNTHHYQDPIDALQPLPFQSDVFSLQPSMGCDSHEDTPTINLSHHLPTCQFQEAVYSTDHTTPAEQLSPHLLQHTLHSNPQTTDSQQAIAVDFTFYALNTTHGQDEEENGVEWANIENIQLDWTEEEKMELRALLL